ncbi:enhancer of mRNA-decapping protein 4-like isoform X2 [Colias croceus]|uniref:enhancer of mRNA-decapping protein 4-like isoform X2 n=1 Tax=Colias crocea TaxID=72248 RepID=UPI001E27F337|nr:enhancer of mRNA-decapping protein 4-like isoform X2 [Colias croceus]
MVINTETNLNRSKSTGNLHINSDNDHDYSDNRANSESSFEWEQHDEAGKDSIRFDMHFHSIMDDPESPFRSLMKKLDNMAIQANAVVHAVESAKQEVLDVIHKMNNIQFTVSEQYPHVQNLSSEIKQSSAEGSDEPSKRLLDAITAQELNAEIDNAVTELLQSDEFKDRVVTTTVDCLRSIISNSIKQAFPDTYRPVLNSFQAKVVRQAKRTLHNAFREYRNSEYFCQSVQETTLSITRAMEKRENARNTEEYGKSLQETLEEILKKELQEWRQNLWDILTPQMLPKPEFPERAETPEEDVPASPSQPPDPSKSIVEQLLKSAMINKLISEGKVNESFEQALSARDLSLVVAACRAAGPALAPRLQQHTLLSLVQQLATDMLHETQLKCRYLEEALINLDARDPTTRCHLPLVVGEVRKHLSNFLKTYPGHVAGRRISLIILAAENLLK